MTGQTRDKSDDFKEKRARIQLQREQNTKESLAQMAKVILTLFMSTIILACL
jgi:hypothetical protein